MGDGDPDKGFSGGIQGQPGGPLPWMTCIYPQLVVSHDAWGSWVSGPTGTARQEGGISS